MGNRYDTERSPSDDELPLYEGDSDLPPVNNERVYITTYSGLRCPLEGLRPQDVRIEDIVHSLSLQCRYMGHIEKFYSVAEHSVLVANLAARDHGTRSEVVRCSLGHDFGEGFIGDFPSPLKQKFPELKEFEIEVEKAVFTALLLPDPEDAIWAEVKKYDRLALHLEASTLFSPPPPWVKGVPEKYYHPIHCLTPADAKLYLTVKLREHGFHI